MAGWLDKARPFRWAGGQILGWAFKGLLSAAWTPFSVALYALAKTYLVTAPMWPFVTIGVAGALLTANAFFGHPLQRLAYRWRVSHWSGISRVYAIHPFDVSGGEPDAELRHLAEEAIRNLIRSSTHVKLLLASGWHYIGCERVRGKLFDELAEKKAAFHLEVLIFQSDDAKKIEKRAAAAHLSPEEYREGINAVLWTLAYWQRTKGWNVEVRTYDDDPIWQMILSDTELWLTCARNTPSDLSPIYCLKRKNAPYGLHFGLYGVWERRWNLGRVVALDKVTEPRWSMLKDSRTAPPTGP